MTHERAVAEAAIDDVQAIALGRLRADRCDAERSVCLRGLVVTAHMCLACRDVGLLIRTLTARPGAPLLLITPAADRNAVEQFLRDERAGATNLLPAPSPALTEDRAPELLGYFELGPDSVEVRRVVGYRAAAILESLDGGAPDPS